MTTYSDRFKAIVLGALLHDIGKFWQRADPEIDYTKSNILGAQTRNNICNICPFRNNNYSHKHSLWTNEFFEKKESIIKAIFNNYDVLREDNPANLASYHHNPSTALQLLIQQADWMSSGMDRAGTEDEKDEEKIKNYRFRKVRLKPIFENIKLTAKVEPKHHYNINPFKMNEESIFPIHDEDLKPEIGEDLSKEYELLWNGFEKDFEKIKYINFYSYVDTLLSLLEIYTWCIPSSTSDLPDISLYDHLKTTTAIASCLYKYHKSINEFNKGKIKSRTEKKFILLGGDLSGIQKYIFNLVHTNIQKLSKILRARSFYLSILPKVIIAKILFENGLTSANTLMDTGGRFILLLPNTDSVKNYLQNFSRILNKWCQKEFYSELTVNMDWSVELNSEDFFNNGFKQKLEQLNHNLEILKLQKLNYKKENVWSNDEFVISHDYDLLVKDSESLCQTCGKKPANPELALKEENVKRVCKSCYAQSEIGEYLTKSSIISISYNPIPNDSKIHFEFFENENTIYVNLADNMKSLMSDPKLISIEKFEKVYEKESVIKKSFIANYVPRFKNDEIDKYKNYYMNQRFSTERLNEELGRIKLNRLKTFSDIAIPPETLADPENGKGVHFLAIIKADVDHLGFIFSHGLKEKVSISRYATLSRMINAFFCGYLDKLLEQKFPNIYTVYAGGDDLFLIGFWQDVINFAQVLNEKFRHYTCNNPDIHLSAGIELIKPRTPVNKGAEKVEINLEKAKNGGRNKLCLFQTLIDWEDFELYKGWIEFFDEAYNNPDSKIKSAFLYRLLEYQKMALQYFDKNKIDGLLYMSKLSYDIKRNIERTDKHGTIVNPEEIDQLQHLIWKADKPQSKKLIKNIHIPIFYTLYKNRGGSNE